MAYYEVDIYKEFQTKLFRSLAIPSSVHTYSLCVEYMKNWFLSKFEKDTFKHVHIEGKHVFDDFRNMTKTEMLKRRKPALSIIPSIELDYDDERLDAYPFGGEIYIKRDKLDNCFFKDRSRDAYIGLGMEVHLVNFVFRAKFSTRAQQLDMYRYMKLFFRVGFTQGEDVSMDFHIPYGLMLQLAEDEGFEIENNKIKDIVGFLSYINQHSSLPFLYKYRCINGNDEFFVRLNNLYVHIRTPDITADEGERIGQLMDNYTIELQAQVRFPAPKFYVYHSKSQHLKINYKKQVDDVIPAFSVKMIDLPAENEKGWTQYLTTEYQEKDLSKPLEIEFKELFEEGELGKIIKYNNSIFISSNICIEFKLFNSDKKLDYEIDWENMVIKCIEVPQDILTFIAVYVDLDYMNTTIANLEGLEKNRID